MPSKMTIDAKKKKKEIKKEQLMLLSIAVDNITKTVDTILHAS